MRPLSGLPKLIGLSSAANRRPARSRRASRAIRRSLLAVGWGLSALFPACSRTARPVDIPDQLAPWTTTLESARRDAWAHETVPLAVERAWTQELGRGVVGPLAIEAGLLFASTVDRRLIVLEASDGEFFWERRLAGAAPAGAVFDRSMVFVASQDRDGSAEAYELARGFLSWRVEIEPPLGAPLLHDRVSYWGTETGRVYALAIADGSRLWRADLAGGVTGSPVLDGTDLLVTTSADTLYRIETRTGRVTARLPLPATPAATAAYDGRLLHLPMHDTTHVVVDVSRWRVASAHRLDSPARTIPVIDDDGSAYLLTEFGTVYRLLPDAGIEVVVELGGAARASLALAANGLLVGRLDGALFFLDFDGNVVWREDFDDSIEAPVAVSGGAVYVPMLRGDLVMLRQAGS